MLRLFRQTRKGALASNKVPKYLFYALGEILLVVIGILIALYINNLNEERKERQFEKKILLEFKASLESDLTYHINNRINRGERIVKSADILAEYFDGKISYHDSLGEHFWIMNWIMIFEPKTTPFETLKAKGIDIISNERLKQSLLSIYDYSYPSILFFTNDFNQWTTNRIEPYLIENFRIDLTENGKRYLPLNQEKLLNDNQLRNLVIEKKSLTESQIARLERLRTTVTNLLDLLISENSN
ncbi:MAG: hypothetical protein AAFO07_01335 [Bacteroidota bacterium]